MTKGSEMSSLVVSKKKADLISNIVGVLALIFLILYVRTWWPGLLLVFWAALATRQLLTGRKCDFVLTTLILFSLFFVFLFNIQWATLTLAFFGIGGAYIILKEIFYKDQTVMTAAVIPPPQPELKQEEKTDDSTNKE